jgi:hypothetical protein
VSDCSDRIREVADRRLNASRDQLEQTAIASQAISYKNGRVFLPELFLPSHPKHGSIAPVAFLFGHKNFWN